MKKYSVVIMSAALVASSCTTGAGAGAYAGSSLGSVLGSAIGGIIGGPHGSDVGTIVGMAGGAVVGGAIGDAADRQQRQEQSEVLARRNQRIQREKAQRSRATQGGTYAPQDDTYVPQGSAYAPQDGTYAQPYGNVDPSQMVDSSNSGDDRIDFAAAPSQQRGQGGADDVPSVQAGRIESLYTPGASAEAGRLTIKNVRLAGTAEAGVLHGGEEGKVVFEIYNDTDAPIYDFDPSVVEADANKRIYISPSVHVENIMPGQGLRYTATVKADRRIRDGQIRLLVSARRGGKPVSYVTVLKVGTVRR